MGEVKFGLITTITFPSHGDVQKHPNGKYAINTPCGCAAATYEPRTNEIIVRYNPKKGEKNKTVTKTISATHVDGVVMKYKFTCKVIG